MLRLRFLVDIGPRQRSRGVTFSVVSGGVAGAAGAGLLILLLADFCKQVAGSLEPAQGGCAWIACGHEAPLESASVFVIEPAEETTDELVESMGRMLPVLSTSAPLPDRVEVAEIVGCPATTLFVARDGDEGPIVGTLTLAMFRIPTGVRAWIEDVIVAEEAQGRGCGEQLTRYALRAAAAAGARTVELTSRPSRLAANRLYQKLGFVKRETNLYRYDLEV